MEATQLSDRAVCYQLDVAGDGVTALAGSGGGKGKGTGKPQEKGAEQGSDKGTGKGKDEGKRKENNSKAKKGPDAFGYQEADSLWVKTRVVKSGGAALCRPVETTGPSALVEVGSFEADKTAANFMRGEAGAGGLGKKDIECLQSSQATIDVCCNRMTALGNPFKMGEDGKNEQLREAVCDAYDEYLEAVTKLEVDGSHDPVWIAREVAARRGGLHMSTEWEDLVQSLGRSCVPKAVESLKGLVSSSAGAGVPIRLMCHCVPKRCHAMALARKVCPPGAEPVEHNGTSAATSVEPGTPLADPQYQSHECEDSPHRLRSHLKQHRSENPVGPDWQGAGAVVFRETDEGAITVCLVEKRNLKLGFPKGKRETFDKDGMDNCKREWREETNLPDTDVVWLNESLPKRDAPNKLYFVGCWQGDLLPHAVDSGGALQNRGLGEKVWDVEDDPGDPDPIIRAYWLSVEAAMTSPSLSQERRILLQDAVSLYSTFRGMAAQEPAPSTRSTVQ
eukprot:TRINITY_DN103167_c0_g1_i1.p1 TRINITY_DN103167_c0_g1~~TRINITY_DN103167_c0_g1_i1.p1  ORF type:complete len:505 (-),score=60.16 TRINITY_DN103167_c0_g1_i1:212-1726(-)